ncbi:probable protein arginine N-methyltransferase 6.2 [Miscanthus floridulus]|uniref:probable protein arginine N-methyltransferase 6.2 n=1 Tax=Miscanthus floridulus TaxID=154761 RepID=UPI0034581F02
MFTGGADGNGHLRRPRRPRRSGVGHAGVMGSPQGQVASGANQHPAAPPCTDYDVAYFKAYSHIGVHEEMLKVYAVDASDIALQAMEIVRENELSDKVVVLHGRIEDVNIEEKVDVIISEWMGYMLLYESMLGSIIFARDKWLKQGGLILPSHASLYMASVTNSQRYHDSIYFWRDVCGIKMSSMMPLAKQCAFVEPSVETISGENVLTWPTVVAQVDCYTIQAQELETITAAFKFTSMLQAPLHGFAFWFDVEFNGPVRQKSKKQPSQSSDGNAQNASPSSKKKKPDVSIVLSTAPEDAPTHWQQTLLYLFEPIELNKDQIIEGSVTVSQSQ